MNLNDDFRQESATAPGAKGSPTEKLGIQPIDLSKVGSNLAPFKADLSEVANTH